MNAINLTLTNVLFKDGITFEPQVEVITDMSRFIRRVLYCEMQFGGRVQPVTDANEIVIKTRVMDNFDTNTLTCNPGGEESFAILKDFFKVCHGIREAKGELKEKVDFGGVTVHFGFNESNYKIYLWGYLMTIGIEVDIGLSVSELESIFSFVVTGCTAEEIKSIL